MDYATSMYLGGSIINASGCNYESSRELGCRCPCCGEAVFLRAGSIRETTLRNKQKATQVVAPAFAHYRGNGFLDDCEKRFYSKETQKKRQVFETEGHNQRLKLYNRHLWEMFKRDRNCNKQVDRSMRKDLGEGYLDSIAINYRKYFASLGSDIFPYVEDAFMMILDPTVHAEIARREKSFLGSESVAPDLITARNYFKHECDRTLHLIICNEICEFLQTRTAGYFWKNLIPFLVQGTVYMHCMVEKLLPPDKNTWKKIVDKLFIQDPNPMRYALAAIVSTRWIDQISQELGQPKIHFSNPESP
jgi:hypothetical protein